MADPSETTQVSVEPDGSETSELLGAVQALSAQVGGLQTELHALRSQVRPLPEPADAPGWGDSPSGAPGELAVGAHARATGAARACRSPAPDRGRFPRGRRARRRDRGARTAGHRARHGGRLGARRARRVAGCTGRPAPWLRTGGAAVRHRRLLRRRPLVVRVPPSSAPRSTLAEDEDTQTRLPAPATD